MTTIRWLPEAVEDLESLHAWLAARDSAAAQKAAVSILDGVNLLQRSPRLGRPMPDETGRRELFVSFGSGAYVLRYMLEPNNLIIVIRIWHSREKRT